MPVSRLGVAMMVVLHLNLWPCTRLVHTLLLLGFKLTSVKSIEFVFHRPGLLLLTDTQLRSLSRIRAACHGNSSGLAKPSIRA